MASDPDQEWGWKRFFLPVTYFPSNIVYPFTLRVSGITSSESEVGNQSEFSLGYKNPEHAVVELSDQNKSLGCKSPEYAVVELSDKTKSLGIKNPEHAVVELSNNQKINNLQISSADKRKDLENE